MGHRFAELAFTDGVKALQTAMGSRRSYARMESAPGAINGALGPDEADFLAARDSFYMATVGETGWPYVQHRGGAPGFVRVLDPHTIGFADLRGNRQYISVGNLAASDKVALIFMDYPNRTRLKVLGRARVVEPSDRATLGRLVVDGEETPVERGILIHVEAFDWNCPQHITPRYTLAEVEHATAPLRARIAELEAELAERGARP